MTRMIRSTVLLAACLGLWSCTSDPTADEAGVPTAIIANPAVMFVTMGDTNLVKLGLVDELGGLVPSTWTLTPSTPEFTVDFDTTYRVVYNPDGTLTLPDNQSEIRVSIGAAAIGRGTFTASASGKSLTITVSVLPANVPATFNTTTPNVGENVVITMPVDLKLLPDASFSIPLGEADPIVVSRAADSSSVTLQLAPGSSGKITIEGVTPLYTPLELTLETTQSVTISNTTALTGSDTYATAPLVTGSFYDLGSFAGSADCGLPCQVYSIDVTAAGAIDFSLTWDNTTDLGLYVLDPVAGAYLPQSCDAHGNGATSQPEDCTITFPAAGTYYLEVDTFGPFYPTNDPDPTWIALTMSAIH